MISHNPQLHSLLKKLPHWMSLLLTLLLGVLLAKLVWLVFAPKPAVIPPAPLSVSAPQKIATQKPDHGKEIANMHLFGSTDVKPKQPTRTPIVKKRTRLNLKLMGVVFQDTNNRLAIIEVSKGKQSVFSIGQEPQSGVKVHDILPHKVILNHNGQLEELVLPKLANNTSSRHSRPSNLSLPKAAPTSRAPVLSQVGSNLVNPAGLDKLPTDDLSALKDVITNNPERLLEIASASEATDKDGNFIGFRLSPGKNRKLFRSLELRPGDVVTSVNGTVLDSPSKGISIMGQLAGASSINFTVRRGNQEVTINKSF
ncbi:MAG: Unknown protein [uncultured Thiotrichaceae bacterium]|uniref:Type II secretion system protein GspC N-terminal domain-containing protein n=1 Tax=uncultured Thiotrichaceae bacterium TaxID=298394 RepID=A0A6S6SS03_9GAMM|nr:MAG: Unknown protein [uncultured Thiotrichaceae bacterium]